MVGFGESNQDIFVIEAMLIDKELSIYVQGRDGSTYWAVDVDVDGGNKPVVVVTATPGAVPGVSNAMVVLDHSVEGW